VAAEINTIVLANAALTDYHQGRRASLASQ